MGADSIDQNTCQLPSFLNPERQTLSLVLLFRVILIQIRYSLVRMATSNAVTSRKQTIKDGPSPGVEAQQPHAEGFSMIQLWNGKLKTYALKY